MLSQLTVSGFVRERYDTCCFTGVADIGRLIYAGHCEDTQDTRIVNALAKAILIPSPSSEEVWLKSREFYVLD